jgi:hypothetical protein
VGGVERPVRATRLRGRQRADDHLERQRLRRALCHRLEQLMHVARERPPARVCWLAVSVLA